MSLHTSLNTGIITVNECKTMSTFIKKVHLSVQKLAYIKNKSQNHSSGPVIDDVTFIFYLFLCTEHIQYLKFFKYNRLCHLRIVYSSFKIFNNERKTLWLEGNKKHTSLKIIKHWILITENHTFICSLIFMLVVATSFNLLN